MKIFQKVKVTRPKRNVFDLSHDSKLTASMGQLIPILCQEVLPGDTWKINTQQLIRMAPMIAPVMHKIDVYTHFFFVPNRILWENWESFHTGGDKGTDSPAFPFVNLSPSQDYTAKLGDYFGFPSSTGQSIAVSAFPLAAYCKIYDEYYRDQNLTNPLGIKLINGNNSSVFSGIISYNSNPLLRAWRHDYFTSALPYAQKGSPVVLPVGGDAEIYSTVGSPTSVDGSTIWDNTVGAAASILKDAVGTNSMPNQENLGSDSASHLKGNAGQKLSVDNSAHLRPRIPLENLRAKLSSAASVTINELRTAFRMQEFLEKNARAGSRYSEFLKAHFGVISSDARLQRPEYIGGSKTPIVISEILQTSDSFGEDPTPQGNMSGHGISVGGAKGFNYYSEEHGQIIGIMSIVPRADYYQGIPRQFRKFSKYDFFLPSFAHVGEQEVKLSELYMAEGINPDETFGYLPRYAEYRFIPNRVHGQFRSTLEYWHLGRKFSSKPSLNKTFVECSPSTRIFAVEDPDWEKLYCHISFGITAKRPLPYYGSPTL